MQSVERQQKKLRALEHRVLERYFKRRLITFPIIYSLQTVCMSTGTGTADKRPRAPPRAQPPMSSDAHIKLSSYSLDAQAMRMVLGEPVGVSTPRAADRQLGALE